MLTIHLHQLIFHSFHGVYEEEQILGNQFQIDADVVVEDSDQIKMLSQTVNYVSIYKLIKERMQQPTPLLETVAQELTHSIRNLSNHVRSVSITIKKIAPPIENFIGIVGVTYKLDF